MPRPKVRPEDRQRAAKACLPCKFSKKRCDAQLPCAHCSRRNNASACTYEDSVYANRTSRRRASTSTHRQSVTSIVPPSSHSQSSLTDQEQTQTQTQNQNQNQNQNHTNNNQNQNHNQTPQYDIPDSFADQGPNGLLEKTTFPQRITRDRLLLSSKGEQVYIGKTASLSFLQFLRHTIRQQMGPSIFTENARRHLMLEINSPEDGSSTFNESDDCKRTLVEAYYAATSGLLDLYSREETSTYLATISTPNDNSQGFAAIAFDLIVAIGGQCRASSPTDLRYAVRCFTRAQKAALAGMLEDPCLDMVRCFLLMAFYMLGACRRNAAFMYLGVASKAASALGLHVTEQYRHFPTQVQSIRLRTLKSLRILDVLVSSILGRPLSTPMMRIDNTAFNNLHTHTGTPRDMALNASFGACSLIAEIMQTLEADNTVDLQFADQTLKRLRDWSSSLPNEIKRFTKESDTPLTVLDQERVIGNIHVACVYYFAVMLVTRPFLISHLMANLPGSTAEIPDTPTTAREQAEIVSMAEACLDSAVYMAQICHEALQSGLFLNAMPLMKAWMFAAGLVIGFSMFVQAEPKFEMDESFNGAREVLKKLSDHSPQAEHYHEILTGFADAIQRHRQHLAREKRRSQNKYVNQILKLDMNMNSGSNGANPSQSTFSPQTLSQELVDAASSTLAAEDVGPLGDSDYPPQPFQLFDASQLPVDGGGGFDFGMFGWDNFAMQISENFTFDSDALWDLG